MLLGNDNYFVVYFYCVCYINIVNENYVKYWRKYDKRDCKMV